MKCEGRNFHLNAVWESKNSMSVLVIRLSSACMLSAPESAHLTTLMWLVPASHSLIALVWRFSGLKHCLACHLQEETDTSLLLEASQLSPPDSLAYHPRPHHRSSCASPLSPGDRSGLFNTDLTHFSNYFLSEPCEQPGTWRGWGYMHWMDRFIN